MFDFQNQVTRLGLPVLQRFADGMNRGRGNVCLGEPSDPGPGRVQGKALLQQGNEYFAIPNAVRVGGESSVSTESRFEVEHPEETLPLELRADRQHEAIAIATLEELVRNDIGMGVAPARRRNAGIQITAANVGKPCELGIE